ncbi:MAG: DUF2752 domain-containing protein, partial [Calditrichaeota bacterium]
GFLLIGLLTARIDQAFLDHMPACLFYKITHLPCPVCGSARTVFYAAHGHWIRAVKANPFIFLVFCGLIMRAVNSVWGVLAHKNWYIRWEGREKKVVFKLLLISWIVIWMISIRHLI